MRAVRYDQFGGPERLRVVDLAEPDAAAGEIKVRVLAAGLNPLDWKIRAGHLRFVPVIARPPRGTGCDFAGEIVAVGGGATERYRGERVFGALSPFGRQGSCADVVVVDARSVSLIPPGVDAETAAAAPGSGATAVLAIEDLAHVVPGQRVLLTGAAGGVGHLSLQLAKHHGAEVVAVCSPANAAFVRSEGADEVVDYTRDDPTARRDRFDLVFDVANTLRYTRVRHLLSPRGLYLGTAGDPAVATRTVIEGALAALSGTQRARNVMLKPDPALRRRLADYLARGVLRPHVTERVGLAQVADAQARMATGHGRGKIVVLPALGQGR